MGVNFRSASVDHCDCVFPGNSGTRALNILPASPLPIALSRSARVWVVQIPKTATPGTPASDETREHWLQVLGFDFLKTSGAGRISQPSVGQAAVRDGRVTGGQEMPKSRVAAARQMWTMSALEPRSFPGATGLMRALDVPKGLGFRCRYPDSEMFRRAVARSPSGAPPVRL